MVSKPHMLLKFQDFLILIQVFLLFSLSLNEVLESILFSLDNLLEGFARCDSKLAFFCTHDR